MTVPIRCTDIAPERAGIDALLRAAVPRGVWSPVEIQDHWHCRRAEIRRRLLYTALRWNPLRSILGRFTVFMAVMARLAPPEWHTAEVVDGQYDRDGVRALLPAPAMDSMRAVRMILPRARFKVSYLGRDPILWCAAVDPQTGQLRHRAILVWDECDGTAVIILSPPSAPPVIHCA